MTTNPFQSIRDTVQHQSKPAQTPANDDQSQTPLDDLIGGLFATRTADFSNSSADFDGRFSRSEDCASGDETRSSGQRPSLKGGEYSEAVALELLNSHFMVGKSKQETAIFRINDDGTISFVPTDELSSRFKIFL